LDEQLRGEMLAFLPRLRRFSHGLAGSADAGDDLLQATCERAIRHIDQFRPGTRLDSWMFRIARNLYLNQIRDRAVRREQPFEEEWVESSHQTDGERIMESRLTYGAVRKCVARLPEEQRSVLLLVTVEGLSYQEVAECLELPMGTIASRLARARLALRAMLEGGQDPHADETVE
jgi:RNA polymerase sigma-70 factor (ECF subfamily)